jgi:hypothetical protein
MGDARTTTVAHTSKSSTWALAFSVAGVLCCFTAIPGLILGLRGLRESRVTGKGRGQSIAAITVSAALLALFGGGAVVVMLTSPRTEVHGAQAEATANAGGEESEGASSGRSPADSSSRTIGVVTGYTDVYGDPGIVLDGGTDVALDLITPMSPYDCDGFSGSEAKAVKAMKSLLPIGQRVVVVWSDTPGPLLGDYVQGLGFVHLLQPSTDTPTPAPPLKSINEELVGSGYWTLAHDSIDTPGEFSRLKFVYSKTWNITPVEEQYVPLLIKAANKARTVRAGHNMTCIGPFATPAKKAAYAAAQQRALEKEWRRRLAADQRRQAAEQRRQQNSPDAYCRDGDGDGICFED